MRFLWLFDLRVYPHKKGWKLAFMQHMQHEMQHEIGMIQYSLKAGGCILSAFYFFVMQHILCGVVENCPRLSIALIPIML